MKVLVIGQGVREHDLVWKIAQSKRVKKIFCAPGNPGTGQFAENIDIKTDDLNKLLVFAKKEKINLTVVGPEAPLILGITDLFEKNGLKIIGPTKKAAQIEGSKVFAKKLMSKYNIPTADFFIFDEYKDARKFIGKQKYPLVIKADGQCAGKGVAVCRNEKQADDFLRKIMIEKIFGSSGKKVVIEKFLTGLEISFMVATDGKNFISFLPSQDHKPVFNGDRGPNTGGMGAYTPVPFVDKNLIKRIEKEIVTPTISAMAKEGCSYKGILYPGLILTDDGPKVLEYNCRFGDPETQPLMFNLKSDIIDIFEAIAKNKVDKLKISWHRGFSICVVLTSKGYPNDYEKGKEISGLDKLKRLKNIYIFHAGTKTDDKKLITYGGRVLGITARGRTLKSAIKLAYRYIGKGGIYFSGMHYRKDIGEKGFLK